MVRSMYSGVAGMKAHQAKMDTIGNNISNVNTFGFKSSRTTFRDVYYQSMRTASGGTSNRGGTNPSQIGYGAVLGSVQVNQGTSTMQNTGNPLDLAITGEGFFQVQDVDGNTFYTKAGILDIDSAGNLVDVNGNFVLGVSGSPLGKGPSSNRIQIAVPSVNPASASGKLPINNVNFKIEAEKKTADGNVTFTFSEGADLPVGQRVKALITSSGINIRVNPKEPFTSDADLTTAVNEAIKEANGGADHPAGKFTISADPTSKFGTLTGAEIIGGNFGVKKGSIPLPVVPAAGGNPAIDWGKIFSITEVGDNFSGGGVVATPGDEPVYTITKTPNADTPPDTMKDKYVFEVKTGGVTYTGELTGAQMQDNGTLMLKGAAAGDTFTMAYPSATSMEGKLGAGTGTNPVVWTATAATDAVSSAASKDLGLGGDPIKLNGGTEGGPQTAEDLTGIAIGADGIIVGNHAVHGLMELGRIDIATFVNPKGLAQAGNTYFTTTANSGPATTTKAGENGTGGLAGGSLEMSNVDLSNEFADMITTQRGFQANSRLITVSDTMLEELTNLKR